MRAHSWVSMGFAVLLLTGAAPSFGGQIDLDLAGGDATIVVEAGEAHTVVLVHYLPGQRYAFDVTVLGRLNETFDAAALGFKPSGAESAAVNNCKSTLAVLYGLSDETKIDLAIAEARVAHQDSDCRSQIDLFEQRTRRVILDPVTVAAGEGVVVDVRRPDGSGERVWTFTLTTGQTQRWVTHYGFSFLPARDKVYFSKENDSGDGFVATRKNDEDDDLEYEPTITFTYIPNTLVQRSVWCPRFTAGLGLDVIDDPVVFAGASWVVGDNVNLFLGGAFHEQTRLDGTYDDGQALEMAIAEDDLNDTRFTANLIAGIGFRFNGNPFKGNGQETKMTIKQPAEGGGTGSPGQSTTPDAPTGNAPKPAPLPSPPSGEQVDEPGSEGEPAPQPAPAPAPEPEPAPVPPPGGPGSGT